MKKKTAIYKNKVKKVSALLLSYLFPAMAFAGILPCGPGGTDSAGNPATDACTLNDVAALINNIIDLLMTIVLPLATVAFAIAGVYMMFAPAKEANYATGKSIMVNTFWGMVFAFSSWVIVKAILVALGYKDAFSWIDLTP